MHTRRISTLCGLVMVAGMLTDASIVLAAATENCNAPANPTLNGAAMSEKLRKCGSVLKPSRSADPDIVIPAPAIDDPLAIHPKDVPRNETGETH